MFSDLKEKLSICRSWEKPIFVSLHFIETSFKEEDEAGKVSRQNYQLPSGVARLSALATKTSDAI